MPGSSSTREQGYQGAVPGSSSTRKQQYQGPCSAGRQLTRGCATPQVGRRSGGGGGGACRRRRSWSVRGEAQASSSSACRCRKLWWLVITCARRDAPRARADSDTENPEQHHPHCVATVHGTAAAFPKHKGCSSHPQAVASVFSRGCVAAQSDKGRRVKTYRDGTIGRVRSGNRAGRLPVGVLGNSCLSARTFCRSNTFLRARY